MLGDIKYQPIIVTISAPEDQLPVEADTDKLYQRCTGIFIALPENNDGAELSTLSRVELNGKELFPDGYGVDMLNATRDVPIDQRYSELNEPAKGSRFKTKYNDAGLADTYPYSVIIYLRLENK